MVRPTRLSLIEFEVELVLDALKDALVELEENELVSQPLLDKLEAARSLLEDD